MICWWESCGGGPPLPASLHGCGDGPSPLLGKVSMKIFGQAHNGLIGELFSACDELVVIGLVVHHVVPLGYERFGRLHNLAGR